MRSWGHLTTQTKIMASPEAWKKLVTSKFIFGDYKLFGKLTFGRVIGQSVNKASMWERGLVAV